MADVVITPNTPTFPVPPAGFQAITLFGFPSYGGLTGDENLETMDFTLSVPFQVPPDDWDFFFQSVLQPGFADRGADLAAYGVWEQAVTDIAVPTTICVPGLTCLDLTQICPPILGCLGGATLLTGYDYRIWMLTDEPAGTSGYLRGEVRGFLPILELIVWALSVIFGLPILVANIKAAFTGQVTGQQLTEQIKNDLPTPGQQINQAFMPFLILGLAVVASGIAIAVISRDQPRAPQQTTTYKGEVLIPTPLGGRVGGGFETRRS